MGLPRISWNSVRVFSKSRTGLLRVLYHGRRFGTAGRIAYAHSTVGTTLARRTSRPARRRSRLAGHSVSARTQRSSRGTRVSDSFASTDALAHPVHLRRAATEVTYEKQCEVRIQTVSSTRPHQCARGCDC